MPNSIGPTGLTVATQAELIAQATAANQAIYGQNINLGPETPDGQKMNLNIQSVLDLEGLLVQINNFFNPDNAVGVILDQRVAINGIQRAAATFTVTNITLVLSQSVNLFGLDQTANPVYTVADSSANQWQLISTHTGVGPGTVVYAFQAANPGAVLTTPNTITVPVSVVLGVASINNPTTYTTLGLNQESDAALKIRRQQSVALPSQGYYQGLLAALENIAGVTYAAVIENDTNATDGNGIPSHSIWVVVAGTGAAADIANAIYVDRSAGCGLYNSGDGGAQSYTITQVDGTFFTVFWDQVIPENLFIKFTASSLNGVTPPNIAAILAGLPVNFTPGVAAQVNINDLATLVQDIDPNTLVTASGFSVSAGGTYTNTLSPTAKNEQFVVASNNIIILPIILNPVTSQVVASTTHQFNPLGGYGPYSYTVSVNNSGASINSAGLYTAGTTTGVTDTIRVTDSFSNTATATVSVV